MRLGAHLLVAIVAQANGNVLVVLVRLGNQLGDAQAGELRRGHSGGERLPGQRHHRRARPEDVHAGGVAVAERRVQANVHQLPSANVLLLGGHIGEDNPPGWQSVGLRQGEHIRLASGGKA